MKTLLISMSIIIVIGAVAFVYLFNYIDSDENDKQSISDMNKYSYETPEMTTDLKNGAFVRIQFLVITDGKKAVEEVKEREFQIQNILIKELAVMSEDDFREGLSEIESALQDDLNKVLDDGIVTDVYTINKILQ
ncbi:MAG TPA: flagellar basal body-associated FliL family protein [Pseudogracilibacillus sp.]|nr:flagellar basal body-associated FliL family protein [Pseudogracilibacillus sp.]